MEDWHLSKERELAIAKKKKKTQVLSRVSPLRSTTHSFQSQRGERETVMLSSSFDSARAKESGSGREK